MVDLRSLTLNIASKPVAGRGNNGPILLIVRFYL